MSLFQCAKCGCVDNTATTEFGYAAWMCNADWEESRYLEALKSYKDIIGIPHEKPFEMLCCECCPLWYDEKGGYGIGPNPNPYVWHEQFAKRYLPKGMYLTDPNTGNLIHRLTRKGPVREDFSYEEFPKVD